MGQMITKLSLMIVFGFLQQSILSYDLAGRCVQKQNESSFQMVGHFPNNSEFGIVSNETLINLIIPEQYWAIKRHSYSSDRFELLDDQLGRNYSIENEMTPLRFRADTKSVLLHLKKNDADKAGQTILYATRNFDPVFYNLDAEKYEYEFSKVNFSEVHYCPDNYKYFCSDSLLSRSDNSIENYDENGYLSSFRIIYKGNLTIECDHSWKQYEIEATVILVGRLDTQLFCSGENCSTPETMNGTKNLISKLGEGKIKNFYKLDFSREESKYFLFFDGNLKCQPNKKYLDICFVVKNETNGKIYLYYANTSSNERATVTLFKSSPMKTALTISNFKQDKLLNNTVVFIEGDQKSEFTMAKNIEVGEENFILHERKDLKLKFSYDNMKIKGAHRFNSKSCKQFNYSSTHQYFSQQIIVCEVKNESHTYFIYKVILCSIKKFQIAIGVN